jgi:hypothetical protein
MGMKRLNEILGMVRTPVLSRHFSYSTEQCYCHRVAH